VKAIDSAIAVEIFHNFTLMHDDIMDKADIRRGKITVHKKWNTNIAILSGDAMLIYAYKFLIDSNSGNNNLVELLNVFNNTAIKVCEGQQLDLNFETQSTVTEEEYLEMIFLKTSILIASALQIGAITAETTKENKEILYQFGKNLGTAFQLQDDLLDCYGDEKKFGKKIGGDIIENKKTFLLISAINKTNIKDKEKLTNCLNNSTDNQKKIETVLSIYEKYNIRKITEEKIKYYNNIALRYLEKLDVNSEKKQNLTKIADIIMKRVK
jgi:geranylgeranyl diphosphate synthase type II